MKRLDTSYSFKLQKEAVKAFEYLLNSKLELEEKADIQPIFKKHPVLILMMAELVGMSGMDIDEADCEIRLWGDFICDLGFGSSKINTYCLIELEDAKKKSIFKAKPTSQPKFSDRFEGGISQFIDWFWKIDGLKNNATEIEHLFSTHNPTIKSILIIGRTGFFRSSTEKSRFKWRSEKTIIDSKKIECLTYDDLLDYYNAIIKRKEDERLLDMEQEEIID
jgi:Domain of unknown function (DUF4263)